MQGRLFGKLPERGDIVIVTPPGTRTDYIKRVIGLPGDTVRMVDGQLIINGQPVKRAAAAAATWSRSTSIRRAGRPHDPALYDFRVQGADGKMYCRVPVVRETLPNGRTYETVELGRSTEDNFGPVTVPAGHLWLMGDNRDDSADSRVPEWQGGLGGPVPWENIGGRAEFITFSLDGIDRLVEPADLVRGAALRPRRKVAPEQLMATRKAPPTDRAACRAARSGGVPRSRSSAARWPRPRCGSAWRLLIVGVIVLAQPLLLIVGGAIFAVFLDGGARLLGRYLPIPRGWRLLLTSSSASASSAGCSGSRGRPSPPSSRRFALVVTAQFDRLMEFVASLGLMPQGPAPEPRRAAARLGRPADQRRRQRRRRGHQRHRDDRHRHLPRRRAADLRPRHRLDAAGAPPRRLLPHRRACRLHAPPPAVRAPRRDGLRRLLHLVHADRSAACRWRRCSASSPASSPSFPTSARSRRAC